MAGPETAKTIWLMPGEACHLDAVSASPASRLVSRMPLMAQVHRALRALPALVFLLVVNGCDSTASLQVQGPDKAAVGELAIFYVTTDPGAEKRLAALRIRQGTSVRPLVVSRRRSMRRAMGAPAPWNPSSS